jgi:hypothetical protein
VALAGVAQIRLLQAANRVEMGVNPPCIRVADRLPRNRGLACLRPRGDSDMIRDQASPCPFLTSQTVNERPHRQVNLLPANRPWADRAGANRAGAGRRWLN